jgi:hypothetical protein
VKLADDVRVGDGDVGERAARSGEGSSVITLAGT